MSVMFNEKVTINNLAVPAMRRKMNNKESFYIYNEYTGRYKDMNSNISVSQFDSDIITSKADGLKNSPISCFLGNVLKRLWTNGKLTHFIVEIGLDSEKYPPSIYWKFWKVPKEFVRRINKITEYYD